MAQEIDAMIAVTVTVVLDRTGAAATTVDITVTAADATTGVTRAVTEEAAATAETTVDTVEAVTVVAMVATEAGMARLEIGEAVGVVTGVEVRTVVTEAAHQEDLERRQGKHH